VQSAGPMVERRCRSGGRGPRSGGLCVEREGGGRERWKSGSGSWRGPNQLGGCRGRAKPRGSDPRIEGEGTSPLPPRQRRCATEWSPCLPLRHTEVASRQRKKRSSDFRGRRTRDRGRKDAGATRLHTARARVHYLPDGPCNGLRPS
jgi:hypothetical protein